MRTPASHGSGAVALNHRTTYIEPERYNSNNEFDLDYKFKFKDYSDSIIDSEYKFDNGYSENNSRGYDGILEDLRPEAFPSQGS